jgi:hypothetical protein
MDTGVKHMAYMWRELNDEWYRIQTNSPHLIDKLKRRDKVIICGKTLVGSSNHWLIFRIQYKKPSTAKQSFLRLTGCKDNYTSVNGLLKCEMSTSGSVK